MPDDRQRHCVITGCETEIFFGEFCNKHWFAVEPKLRMELTVAKKEFHRARTTYRTYCDALRDAENKYVTLRRQAIEQIEAVSQ